MSWQRTGALRCQRTTGFSGPIFHRPQRRYYPGETDKHPWFLTPGGVRVEDLPRFLLPADEQRVGDDRWVSRDEVHLCGSDMALAHLAELLLKAGRPDNPVLEYELEGEGGFRGVGIHSAEVWFFLPGSLGYTEIL